MATQLKAEELNGCKSYLGWLREKTGMGHETELTKMLFQTDFKWTMSEDNIRAEDALQLRKDYADEIGEEKDKTEREIDRIWKSIHGNCSIFELLTALCKHLDSMVNEEEEGKLIPIFFRILCEHLALTDLDDEDFDQHPEETEAYWKAKIDRFIYRQYDKDGANGGLFPLKKAEKDQRKISIWYQMGAWLNENLDENGQFLMPKEAKIEARKPP